MAIRRKKRKLLNLSSCEQELLKKTALELNTSESSIFYYLLNLVQSGKITIIKDDFLKYIEK